MPAFGLPGNPDGALPTNTPDPDAQVPAFELETELSGYPGGIWNLTFNPDGTLLAAGGSRRAVMVWTLATGEGEYYLEPAELGVITGLDFSSDGRQLIAGGNAEYWYWDTDTPSSINYMKPTDFGFTTMSSKFHVAQTGSKAAFADAHGNLVIAELSSDGTYTKIVELDDPGVTSPYEIVFNRDGSILFTGTGQQIDQWDTETGKHLTGLSVDGSITELALNSDGTLMAVGTEDPETQAAIIQLWDVATGKVVATLNPQKGPLTSITFSPNGKLLAWGSSENVIYIWDVETHKQLAELNGPTGWGKSLAFSPDSTLLASGGDDGVVRLWSIVR
jgi:WD40 repeat protein